MNNRATYLCIAIVLFLLTGCVTERACRLKFPPQVTDSVSDETRINLRDTNIVVYQAGVDIHAQLPKGFLGNIEKQKGNLKLRISATEQGTSVDCSSDSLKDVIKVQLKEIERLKKHVRVEKVTVQVKYVPSWIYILIGSLIALSVYLFFTRR